MMRGETVAVESMPELERLMLHRLSELDGTVREGYDAFDFKKVFAQLNNFMNVELSAFYFDIRKDALYCDAPSSLRRKASLQVVSHLFDCLTAWLAADVVFHHGRSVAGTVSGPGIGPSASVSQKFRRIGEIKRSLKSGTMSARCAGWLPERWKLFGVWKRPTRITLVRLWRLRRSCTSRIPH